MIGLNTSKKYYWGITSVLASNGVFRKVSDTQFIIIVDNDTMVYIIYPKCDDAVCTPNRRDILWYT